MKPYPLSLTRYVLVDAAYQTADAALPFEAALPLEAANRQFMLSGALLYDQRLDYWWAQVVDVDQRVTACARMLSARGMPERLIDMLATDTGLRAWMAGQPPSAWDPILKAAHSIPNGGPLTRLLGLVRSSTQRPAGWQRVSFSPETDQWLGRLAGSRARPAPEALALIGNVRSEMAVQTVLVETDRDRLVKALEKVYETGAGLPRLVPARLRWRVVPEVLLRQLTAEPRALLTAYFLCALGGLVGFGGFVFFSYRLPTFMDTLRWLIALERGVYWGVLAGFGIFIARAVTLRVKSLPRWGAALAGTATGGLALLAAFVCYDVLFLDVLPAGWLLLAGSFAAAAAFGLSAGLVKNLWLRTALSAAGVGLALMLSLGTVSRNLDVAVVVLRRHLAASHGLRGHPRGCLASRPTWKSGLPRDCARRLAFPCQPLRPRYLHT